MIGPGSPNPSGLPSFNVAQGLVAKAGGGQVGATPLPAFINEITIVATANDSVMLPPGFAGARITVINDAANAVQVFGYLPPSGAGDTIALSTSAAQSPTGTGVTQPAASIADYVCFVGENGNTNNTTAALWKQFRSA